MKTYFSNSYKLLNASLCLSIIFVLGSCQKEAINESNDPVNAKMKVDMNEDQANDEEMANTAFPSFHQGFNHSIAPWADKNTSEEEDGWCGIMELKSIKDGEIKPSAGEGYATVTFGECNTTWQPAFPDGSAPATLDPSLFSQTWPESGFIHELDIYLDPSSFEAGTGFDLFFGLYYDYYDYPFDYYDINVVKENGNLLVNGEYAVADAGWYTFKQSYDKEADGTLTADFELQSNHKTVYTSALETTVMGKLTSSFNIEEIYADGHVIGSGYLWFPYIAPGVELAIDEYRLRPGK